VRTQAGGAKQRCDLFWWLAAVGTNATAQRFAQRRCCTAFEFGNPTGLTICNVRHATAERRFFCSGAPFTAQADATLEPFIPTKSASCN
jgi:hypothetical protein